MKKNHLLYLFFSAFFLLTSCSSTAESSSIVINEAEVVTLPSGNKTYYPVSDENDLKNAIFEQHMPDIETIHLEFDTDNKRFIKRKRGDVTTSLILKDIEINTYLDVYEVVSEDVTLSFIKIGPRIIEDE